MSDHSARCVTSPIRPANTRLLVQAAVAQILMILIHDLDHIRQAYGWCYTIPVSVWLVNVSVYMPVTAALVAAVRQHRLAPTLLIVAGLLTASSFARVHLWRPFLPVWGIWNKSYLALGVDAASWLILVATVAVGVGAALVGAFVLGRQSTQRPRSTMSP